MVAVERIEISKPVSLEIIDNRMKEIESETKRQRKILQKLRFVRLRYLGYTVPEACRIENVSVQTGYNWQDQWNESGFDSRRLHSSLFLSKSAFLIILYPVIR